MKSKILLAIVMLISLTVTSINIQAQIPTNWSNRTIASGSKIIDMGVTPQSKNNAIKPFGLIYDLLANKSIPILWAIKPNKAKDAVDFVQNGVSYSSGAFIIEAAYLSASVNTIISNWISQGVVVRTMTSSGSIPIFTQINAAPNWTIDQDNPNIATGFLTDAGIPSSAYSTKTPSLLNSCDHVFAMPHADPTWATHSKIYSWVQPLDSTGGYRGWFWGGCHAVSVMENLANPALSWQKMNFLSTNGLVPFGSHHDGSKPYINDSFPAHPFMQFLGTIDNATNNGSEQIYMPKIGSAWRATTQIGVYDATQQDVPGISPGKAAVLLFGPAFGNYNGGYVLYEAGHDVSGSAAANFASERAFFNFSFLAPVYQPQSVINAANIPDTLYAGNTRPISVTVSGNGAPFTYQWSSTCTGAAFSAPTSATTNITMPGTTSGACTVTIKVTNACGKVVFSNKPVWVAPVIILPFQLLKYSISYTENKAKLYWEVGNEEKALSYSIERSTDGTHFMAIGSVVSTRAGMYDYIDPTVSLVQKEVVYYRIRLIEKDGIERLSPIMILRMTIDAISRPTIKPNPAKNYITISLNAKSSSPASLNLVNIEGKIVLSKKITLASGENSFLVNDLDKLPSGMYTVVIFTDKEKSMSKFYILK